MPESNQDSSQCLCDSSPLLFDVGGGPETRQPVGVHFVHVKLDKPTRIASHLIQSYSSIRAVRNSKFRRRDLESLESWLDFKIFKLIFVIPVNQIRACASRGS